MCVSVCVCVGSNWHAVKAEQIFEDENELGFYMVRQNGGIAG